MPTSKLLGHRVSVHEPGPIGTEGAYPPQMQSPTMSSQGFTDCHRFVTSPWRMPACRCRLQNGAVGSFIDRASLHSRLRTARLASRLWSSVSGRRLGIIRGHRVEGGHRSSASGAPARRGAHNGETLVQQPHHQCLVRESIPRRVAETLSVDAFCRLLSRHIAYRGRLCDGDCRRSDPGQESPGWITPATRPPDTRMIVSLRATAKHCRSLPLSTPAGLALHEAAALQDDALRLVIADSSR